MGSEAAANSRSETTCSLATGSYRPTIDATIHVMKYAILVDIHANLPALEAVLADMKKQDCRLTA